MEHMRELLPYTERVLFCCGYFMLSRLPILSHTQAILNLH